MSIKGRKKSSEIQGTGESWTCGAIKSPSKLPLLAEGAILGSVFSFQCTISNGNDCLPAFADVLSWGVSRVSAMLLLNI